jgi:hypothetical protein
MTGRHPIRGLIHVAAIVRRETRKTVLTRLTRELLAQGAKPMTFMWDEEQPVPRADED